MKALTLAVIGVLIAGSAFGQERCIELSEDTRLCYDPQVDTVTVVDTVAVADTIIVADTARILELEAALTQAEGQLNIARDSISVLLALLGEPEPEPEPTVPPTGSPEELRFETNDGVTITAIWTPVEHATRYRVWGAGIGPEDPDRTVEGTTFTFTGHPDVWFCVRAENNLGISPAWRCNNYRDILAGIPHTVTVTFACMESDHPDFPCLVECPEAETEWATPSACACIQQGLCTP